MHTDLNGWQVQVVIIAFQLVAIVMHIETCLEKQKKRGRGEERIADQISFQLQSVRMLFWSSWLHIRSIFKKLRGGRGCRLRREDTHGWRSPKRFEILEQLCWKLCLKAGLIIVKLGQTASLTATTRENITQGLVTTCEKEDAWHKRNQMHKKKTHFMISWKGTVKHHTHVHRGQITSHYIMCGGPR